MNETTTIITDENDETDENDNDETDEPPPPWWSSQCDELQCTSTSVYGDLYYSTWYGNDYYWCWGRVNDMMNMDEENKTNDNNNFSCATDGYIGVPLTSVELLTIPNDNDQDEEGGSSSSVFQYYTCCPRDVVEYEYVKEGENKIPIPLPLSFLPQCATTQTACNDYFQDCIGDGVNEPMSCKQQKNDDESNSIYKYPRRSVSERKTFLSWEYSQFRCCSTPYNGQSEEEHGSTILVPESIRFGLSTIASIFILSLILGIVCNRKVRKQSFNLYIIFLAMPDLILNVISMLISGYVIFTIPLPSHSKPFPNECSIHFFPQTLYTITTYWLSVCIVYEIHKLLKESKLRRRCLPPTNKKVYIQSTIIYIVASLLGYIWIYIHCLKVPIPKDKLDYVQTMEYQILNLLVILFNGIVPFIYLVYVLVHIWRAKLIPRSGRTRVLVIYFTKIIVVFMIGTLIVMPLIITIPFNIIIGAPYYTRYIMSIITILTTIFAMMKPDIKQSVMNILFCGQQRQRRRSPPSRRGSTNLVLNFQSEDDDNQEEGPTMTNQEGPTGSSDDNSGGGANSHQEIVDAEATVPHTKKTNLKKEDASISEVLHKKPEIIEEEVIEFYGVDGGEQQQEEESSSSSSLFFTNLPEDSIWNIKDNWNTITPSQQEV